MISSLNPTQEVNQRTMGFLERWLSDRKKSKGDGFIFLSGGLIVSDACPCEY
jgi:hypothetical protein